MPVLMLRVCAAVFALLGVFPLANVLRVGPGVPWYRVAVLEWIVRGGLVVAVAFLGAIALGMRVDAWAARVRRAVMAPSPRRFALLAGLAVSLAAVGLSWYCFSGRPFTSDEMAQQWHARILLAGRLFAVAEPAREFFNTAPVLDTGGRWFSQYPAGGPAFIALGMLVGAAWLVNPIMLGVCAAALYGFLRRTAGDSLARLATILFAISPMVMIMGASQMNHVPALMLALLALWALARWNQSGSIRDAWPIGVTIGVLAMVRPLDAVVLAVVVAGFQLSVAAREPGRWKSLALQAAAGMVLIALALWINLQTTGSAGLFGYEALNGPEHGLGFHVDPNGEMHSPLRGLAYVSGYLLRLSRYLFEWAVPGMLLVMAGMTAVRSAGRWDMLLLALSVGFLVAYGAYWFDGFFSGPRFLFTAVPAFLYFAARGVAAIGTAPPDRVRRSGTIAVVLCILVAWLGPDGISSARGRARLYHEQRTKLKTDVAGQVERAGLSNAVVFVNEGWRGRLLARLRVLGASQFRAERLASELDACALGDALDDAARLPALPAEQRLGLVIGRARAHGRAVPVADLPADQRVSLVPGIRPSASCIAQFHMDSLGTIPYPPFLPLHRLDDEGRISGPVVFARDLGPRNAALRERFGDRRWYRYRPPSSLSDTANPFVPYPMVP